MSQKAIFLDRDGTLIVDPPDLRVNELSELELFPQTVPALELLKDSGYIFFIVTNQAGIAEGLINDAQFWLIEEEFERRIAPSGITVLRTYMCPHSPDDGCACRKPQPAMLLEAAQDYNIDMANSYMIGDRQTDIQTGINAGTKTILVKTGNNPVEAPEATHTALTIMEAAQYILDRH